MCKHIQSIFWMIITSSYSSLCTNLDISLGICKLKFANSKGQVSSWSRCSGNKMWSWERETETASGTRGSFIGVTGVDRAQGTSPKWRWSIARALPGTFLELPDRRKREKHFGVLRQPHSIVPDEISRSLFLLLLCDPMSLVLILTLVPRALKQEPRAAQRANLRGRRSGDDYEGWKSKRSEHEASTRFCISTRWHSCVSATTVTIRRVPCQNLLKSWFCYKLVKNCTRKLVTVWTWNLIVYLVSLAVGKF